MRPRDHEPVEKDLEDVLKDEERSAVRKSGIPDDVKAEVDERLKRFEDLDRDQARGDGP